MSSEAVGGAGAADSAAAAEPIIEEEKDDGYKVAAKVDLKTMVEKDSEDESLRKYKAALLGAAASGVGEPEREPRIPRLRFTFASLAGTSPLLTSELL